MLPAVHQLFRRLLRHWNVSEPSSQILARRLLADFDYDFAHYTRDSFIHRVEEYCVTTIELVPRSMTEDTFGAWIRVRSQQHDLILYEDNTSQLHQNFIILHEVGHLLLGHQTATVSPQQAEVLKQHTGELPDVLQRRSFCRSSRAEDDAEAIAILVLERVLQHVHLRDNLTTPPDETGLASYFKAMRLVEV